jgi:lysophospholipid acyltransferase (LPLAT)-like uncharacterized protein
MAIRTWVGTMRRHDVVLAPGVHPTTPEFRGLYCFWHENMLLPGYLYGGLGARVLISQHADGQIITEVIRRLGFGAVRGSTTRGGVQALRTIMSTSRDGHLVFTPDGPRGPRREVKPGIVYVASRTGLPVVPVGVGYDRPWRAGSWDRLAVPRPFSRGVMVFGEALAIPPDVEGDDLERFRSLVNDRLTHVSETAETWAVHGVPADAGRPAPLRRSA